MSNRRKQGGHATCSRARIVRFGKPVSNLNPLLLPDEPPATKSRHCRSVRRESDGVRGRMMITPLGQRWSRRPWPRQLNALTVNRRPPISARQEDRLSEGRLPGEFRALASQAAPTLVARLGVWKAAEATRETQVPTTRRRTGCCS